MKFPSSLACCTLTLSAAASAQGGADYSGAAYNEFLSIYDRLEFIGDTDGDGAVELVGWWRSRNGGPIRVRTFRPNMYRGTHGYDQNELDPLVWFQAPNATAAGDIDGDGVLDVVLVYGGEIFVLRDFGNGVELSETLVTGIDGHWPYVGTSSSPGKFQLALADLDGDGRDSAVLLDGRRAFVYAVDGSSMLAPDFTIDLTGGAREPIRIRAADFDHDGDEDIAILRSDLSVHRLSVYLEDDLVRPTIFRHDLATEDTELAVGDVDGDGDDDAIVFGLDSTYQIFMQQSGVLLPQPTTTGGPATHLIDLDGDGDLDGACCGGGGGGGISNEGSSTFHVCFNDGTGQFTTSTTHASVGAHHLAGAIDWDGDGDLDLLAGRSLLLNHAMLGHAYCPGQLNSAGRRGRLGFTGSARRSVDDLIGHISGLPPGNVGIMLVARFHDDPTPLGQGNLCLAGGLGFTRMRLFTTDPAGTADFDIWSDPPPVSYGPWNPQYSVEAWSFQAWYRDAGPLGVATSNLTNAVQIYLVR